MCVKASSVASIFIAVLKAPGNIDLTLLSKTVSNPLIKEEYIQHLLELMESNIYSQVNFDFLLGLHKSLMHLIAFS